MRTAVARARILGAEAVFVLGDPLWYERFGFRADAASGFTSPYAGQHLMVLAMTGSLPVSTGEIVHAPAFAKL
jgi:putative acetyltransferase